PPGLQFSVFPDQPCRGGLRLPLARLEGEIGENQLQPGWQAIQHFFESLYGIPPGGGIRGGGLVGQQDWISSDRIDGAVPDEIDEQNSRGLSLPWKPVFEAVAKVCGQRMVLRQDADILDRKSGHGT